jgi:hypothetical protein
MAKKKTEKTPYLSSYGAGYIRSDQWLTEKLCALIAKKRGGELPDKFWNLSKWKNLFRRQVQIASSILIMYDAEAISRALRDKRMRSLNSFVALKSENFFSKVLDEYQSEHEAQKKLETIDVELVERLTTIVPSVPVKDNKLSRLKKIDVQTRPIQSG